MLFGVRNDLYPSAEDLRIVSITGLYATPPFAFEAEGAFFVNIRK